MEILRRARNCGFSLVEFAIVVVILGVLATFAVPRFMNAVERSKTAEAFNFGECIQAAEADYQARNGCYAASLADLNLPLAETPNFTVTAPSSANWTAGWEIKLTRSGSSAGYGSYTVTFDQNGFNAAKSSVPAELLPPR